jgi:hypothetical protein
MASSLGSRRAALGCQGAPLGERYMERDGQPPDFSSPEAYRVSRREFKKLIDTPALTKMTVLLAKDKEMKIHTAARIAARYTTGASADSIARRLVKRFPVSASVIMNVGRNDGRRFVDDEICLYDNDDIILINLLTMIEDHIEENFFPLLALSRNAFEMFFNNHELLGDKISWFHRALVILEFLRPVFYRKIIFTVS